MPKRMFLPAGFMLTVRSTPRLFAPWVIAIACSTVGSIEEPLRAGAAAASFSASARPLLETHCMQCHGAAKQNGDVDFAKLGDRSSILRARKTWRKAIAQIEAGEMPPADEKQLSSDDRARLLAWMKQAVDEAAQTDPTKRDPGPAPIHRLNQAEYNHTVRDLLGIEFNAADAVGMPDDSVGHGYGKLAGSLILSPALIDKYFAAAEKILDRLYGTELSSRVGDSIKKQAKASREALLRTEQGAAPRDSARAILSRLTRRAYRRPVTEAEIDVLVRLYERGEKTGAGFNDSLRLPLKAILVSPHFLFRVEEDRAPAGSVEPYRVSDHELAARLSYFLWSSMPDEELFKLADEQKLSDPATLEMQTRRMLADPKARALTQEFAAQWLQINDLPSARPSTEFFPTFREDLRKAMYLETTTFVDKLREEDRSVLELLDADYTYLNQDLAAHYNVPGVEGKQMRRVELKPEYHRGGLLGMGSMLAVTSHTSRTSPTMRGRWVLAVLFGDPPPPPPADAGVLKEEKEKGKQPKSFRELMAMHAGQPACQACHRKMDPLGYALENFNAIGSWREDAGGQPLDTTGVLPSGEKFQGVAELKKLVLSRQSDFERNLAEQIFVYALGRELDYHDDAELSAATGSLARDGHKFSALVLAVVNSYPFQHRRNVDDAGEPVKSEPTKN